MPVGVTFATARSSSCSTRLRKSTSKSRGRRQRSGRVARSGQPNVHARLPRFVDVYRTPARPTPDFARTPLRMLWLPRPLASISPPSRHHLASISPPSRLHLAPISPPSRHHLASISPPSRLHLQVCLDRDAAEAAWFRVLPRLRVHSEGERVRVGVRVLDSNLRRRRWPPKRLADTLWELWE